MIYLVDAAGTRTSSFPSLLLVGTRIEAEFYQEVDQVAQSDNFWLNDDGTEIFHVNGSVSNRR